MRSKKPKAKAGHLLSTGLAAISLLVTKERGIKEVAARLDVQERQAYRILQNLERAGLEVHARRQGTYVLHRISASSVKQALGI